MARYSCSYWVNASVEELPDLLAQILRSCELELIHQTIDYMMAREIPGKIAFAKLVTVDIFLDPAKAKNHEIPLTWIVKNDELPLQLDNHCWQRFEQLQQAIANHRQWRLVSACV